MKLTTWIDNNGGTAPTAALLGIARNCVYAWLKGIALPRPDMMQKIVKFTGGQVSYAEMIEEHNGRKKQKAKYKREKSGVKIPRSKSKRGHNSLPSIMKRVIAADIIRRKVMKARKNKKVRVIIDPGF